MMPHRHARAQASFIPPVNRELGRKRKRNQNLMLNIDFFFLKIAILIYAIYTILIYAIFTYRLYIVKTQKKCKISFVLFHVAFINITRNTLAKGGVVCGALYH